MRNEFVRFLMEKISKGFGDDVVVITGDLGYSVLEPLRAVLGKRFINAGVAEASMTTVAAALASEKMRVFTYSITPFATFRCLEQIRNDICYHDLDVTVVGVGAGFGYGALGPTHHATEDLAAMWSLPNMRVYSPGDLNEAKASFEDGWSHRGPQYWRIGKGGEKSLQSGFAPVHAVNEYFTGTELSIVCCGNVLPEVYAAVKAAPAGKYQLLSCPRLKPFPEEELLNKISTPNVLFVEELNPYGSFSSVASRALLTRDPQRWKSVRVISAGDRFADRVGSAEFQRQCVGLDSPSILEAIVA